MRAIWPSVSASPARSSARVRAVGVADEVRDLQVRQHQVGDLVLSDRLALQERDQRVAFERGERRRTPHRVRVGDRMAHPGSSFAFPHGPAVASRVALRQPKAGRLGLPTAGRGVVGRIERRAGAEKARAVAGQAAGAADADLRGDDRAAVRLDVPHVRERERHQVARRQSLEELDLLAGGAVVDRIAHDAVPARVGPGRDRRVTRGRDRGRVRHARVIEESALASQAADRGQLTAQPVEVVRAHAVEDEQQHGAWRAPAGDERLAEGAPGRARQHDAQHPRQRGSEVLLRHGRAEHALADTARTPEQERDAHVVVPRAAVHERGPAARDELALLRHQRDLAAAARVVGAREHRERPGAVGDVRFRLSLLRDGGARSGSQEDPHRERTTEAHPLSGLVRVPPKRGSSDSACRWTSMTRRASPTSTAG